MFHCPVLIFSKKNIDDQMSPELLLTGSGRSIEGISIVDIVKGTIAQQINLAGGGHPMAMGVNLQFSEFHQFAKLFDEYVKKEAKHNGLSSVFYPEVNIDHHFTKDDVSQLNSVSILDDISRLEPYGIRFESPVFSLDGTIQRILYFGKNENLNAHANILFVDDAGFSRRATVFFYSKCTWMQYCNIGSKVTFAVTLNYDNYRKEVGMLVLGASQ